MSTQNRNSGGGRNQKKSNSGSGGGGGGDSALQTSNKKTDVSKTEKEKSHPKPTAEQLRIAQITNSNTSEDPQMREKVATLIEMTQRSEEEVCCALYECDNDLERAVVYLLETLPVGAFETSSKKKKNKAASAGQENAGGDGEWIDSNANTDRREKSRNRSSNRGGRGGTDSRGWRGREARENERNLRDSRGGDDRNDNYRRREGGGGGGGGGSRSGGGRGGGYAGRGGRGGGRFGGGGRGTGGRGERGYNSRSGANEDHQEVELWDNTIAQNAEKQQQQLQDDAWGDWDNEEYVGSLKDSKVFTTSNLPNQTAASVVSGGVSGVSSVVNSGTSELSAPPGLEHHLSTSGLVGNATSPQQQQQGSHLNTLVGSSVGVTGGSVPGVVSGSSSGLIEDNSAVSSTVVQSASVSTTPMMQYSAAVTSSQLPQSQPLTPQQQQQQQQPSVLSTPLSTAPYGNAADTFSNAATAAANLVQQVQQQQQQPQSQIKASATLSAEQSQYFNSLTSQNAAAAAAQQPLQQQQQLATTYAQSAAAVQYPTSYANVFGSAAAVTTAATAGLGVAGADQSQLSSGVQQPQVRRARAKLPPPSKIPSTAVEMPGDTLNNIGYLDVQFGGLDFGTEDTFEALPEKFGASVTMDGQQQQPQQTQSQQLVQSQQDVTTDYQSKSTVQQQQSSLTAGLQSAQLGDALSSGYSQRGAGAVQQQQQVVSGGSGVAVGVGVGGGASSVGGTSNHTLDLSKSDPYGQSQSATNSAGGYQTSAYQTSVSVANKTANAYQPSAGGQVYNSSSYANVQSSVANTYQPQSYGAYQQNSMNSYQQQAAVQTASNSVTGGAVNVGGSSSGNTTQNIPVVGGSGGNSNANNTNTGYLSSGYPTQQSAYQSSQSVYGGTGLSNSTGFAGSTNTSSSQYSSFSASAKLKDTATASSGSHYEGVSSSNVASSSGAAGNSAVSANSVANSSASVNSNNSNVNSNSSSVGVNNSVSSASNSNTNSSSTVSGGGSGAGGSGSGSGSGGGGSSSSNPASVVAAAAAAAAVSSSSNKTSASGMVPNIQMVSQYIQTGLPYYQQPVYSYEDIQMMQQRVPHVQGYYDLNYTPTSLGTGRDNLGSVAYSTMTDARFTRTDNNSSPVSNVSSTMSQQAGSSGPMLNVPYYFYSGNVMPGSFQYGTPAIYPQQIPAANTASGGQFPKPSYNTGYGSTSYDTLSQASQDYTKGAYPSSVNQQSKSQNVANPPQTGTSSDITSSMYGKGHVALNKVNSYEKQNFHSGTPPPFNMPNTQTAGGTSAQPYGMYLPMPTAGHHNMIHQPIHQMDGRIHNSSRRDSNSTGQRQQTSSQSKSAAKQGYSPSYWTGQN
ncbi:PREDICTED: protein lingerer isoform X3 [Rhagoletis zephyria]|uniref:protein lingerer isoform X3 n=1 Tax=Rhagoletis zephyria TaxID=28612 RepID=UPI00081126C9|nr:PREDICTED: protein lingerer isoform X3 [Rhagoletis zephyria]